MKNTFRLYCILNIQNEDNMETLLNQLSNIKDMIINEKSKYQKNILSCCNSFSRRLDELNICFTKPIFILY